VFASESVWATRVGAGVTSGLHKRCGFLVGPPEPKAAGSNPSGRANVFGFSNEFIVSLSVNPRHSPSKRLTMRVGERVGGHSAWASAWAITSAAGVVDPNAICAKDSLRMDEDRHRATDAEIEIRRAQVLRLRFAGLTESEIAGRFGVSTATVSRDLAEIHENWAERFRSKFDVVDELADAASLFQVLEAATVRELLRLEAKENGSTASMVKCIQVAGAMRTRRINLLVIAGLMTAIPLAAHGLPSAEVIRQAIEAAKLHGSPLTTPLPLVSRNA
jgi:hypothetical protein